MQKTRHTVLYTLAGFAVYGIWLNLLCPSIRQLAILTAIYLVGTLIVGWEYYTHKTRPSIAVAVFILGGLCSCVLVSIVVGIATLVYSLS